MPPKPAAKRKAEEPGPSASAQKRPRKEVRFDLFAFMRMRVQRMLTQGPTTNKRKRASIPYAL